MPTSKETSQRNSLPPIVIVEDDAATLEILRAILQNNGLNPVPFPTGLDALDYIRHNRKLGAFLIDISLPDIDGIELLREARKIRGLVPGYILTASDDAKSAVMAMKAGATDYFTKPFEPQSLVATLHAALSLRSGEVSTYEDKVEFHDRWKSGRMKAALNEARRATLSNNPVVICGPIGSGKNSIARLIHEGAPSSRKGFRRIDLAELSEAQAEIELFGHTLSSTEESHHSSPGGRLVKSKGGTLYLANFENLGLRAQAELFDWLRMDPVVTSGNAGTRLICSTAVDMEPLMESGLFRRDLWFRCAVHRIEVPALCQRPEDIPILCEDILTSICVKGKLRRPTLTRKAMEAIQDYSWPYNLMELYNALEHAVANTPDRLISPADLPRFVQSGNESPVAIKAGNLGFSSIDEMTKASVEGALEACGGNRRRAAQRLKVSLRTIYYMINRYELAATSGRKRSVTRKEA